MRPDDPDSDLNDGYLNAHWLHGRINDLPPAARWDFKDAVKVIREFNEIVRAIKRMDEGHVVGGYDECRVRARMP
jgi:hypothetical protein